MRHLKPGILLLLIAGMLTTPLLQLQGEAWAQRGRGGHGGGHGGGHQAHHHQAARHHHMHHVHHVHMHVRLFHPHPWWHPIGFAVAAVATTAIIISATNNKGEDVKYHYDKGTWYEQQGDVYIVISAPMGAVVPQLPDGNEPVQVSGKTYYYYAGDFYAVDSQGYKVIKAPRGAVVSSLPEGYKEQETDDGTTYTYNDVKYEAQTDGDTVVYVVD